jgi:hypothetical protein
MLCPIELCGRKQAQSSNSLYPLIYRRMLPFVEGLFLSARALPAGQPPRRAVNQSGRAARADPISLKGEALSLGRTMDMLEVVGFGFMSLVWVAFVVVTARPRTV